MIDTIAVLRPTQSDRSDQMTSGSVKKNEKAIQMARDFEKLFINQLLQGFFPAMDKGVISDGLSGQAFRGFLIDNMSSHLAKSGDSFGLSRQFSQSLISLQEGAQ